MTLAALAIAGFLLRGYWRFTASPLHQNRAARIVPHVNDALFLASGIALVHVLHLPWLHLPWLLAKFAGLGVYIGLGMIAFRFARTSGVQAAAFVGAVAAFAYVVGAAISKSPLSWLGL